MASKTYVKGSAKKIDFDNGGSIINLSVNLENLKEHADEKGWVRLVCSERTSPDMYGNTHSLYLNEWKPTPKADTPTKAAPAPEPTEAEDDLPF